MRVAGALLAVFASSVVVIGAAPANAAGDERPVDVAVDVAAEVPCDSFTHEYWGLGLYLHVPSVGADTYNYNCVVVRGHRGIAVLVVQESLNRCFAPLEEDGDFGGGTQSAVRNAQREINRDFDPDALQEDGRFGPRTSSLFRFQLYDHWNGGSHTGICVHSY